jgi:hypothetical protein
MLDKELVAPIQHFVDQVIEASKQWNRVQKAAAFLFCLVAGVALVSGYDYLRIGGGLAVILFGIMLLTPVGTGLLGRNQEIVLHDEEGRPKVVISAKFGVAVLDDNQQLALGISVRPGGAHLGVGSKDGPRVELLASKDVGAHVMLIDPGRGMAARFAYKTGDVLADLTMNGVDGAPVATFPDLERVAQYAVEHGLAGGDATTHGDTRS